MLLMLCIKIFFIRILDVSLGTIRTILIIKGKNITASITGFIEVAIWFAVVREALNTEETSLWVIVAYAGGFAIGTLVGSILSEKFIQGNLGVQVITEHKDTIIKTLHEKGYAVSVIDVRGKNEDNLKYMLFIEINKKKFDHLRKIIKNLDPKAFIVVNETKYVQNGYFK